MHVFGATTCSNTLGVTGVATFGSNIGCFLISRCNWRLAGAIVRRMAAKSWLAGKEPVGGGKERHVSLWALRLDSTANVAMVKHTQEQWVCPGTPCPVHNPNANRGG